MTPYDLAILGSGPGGYVAALYAARRGMRVAVVEKDALGGTCLNRGCIPTKAMLHAVGILETAREASVFGIDIPSASADYSKIIARRDEVVTRLRNGIETLFRANKIDLVRGTGRFSDAQTIVVEGPDAPSQVRAKHFIIATGSRPVSLPTLEIDEQLVLSSDGILALAAAPKSLLIIGGGVIGCEFASIFSALGAKVTIVELFDRLVPNQSREASKKLETIFKKRGIDVLTRCQVQSLVRKDSATAKLSNARSVDAEKVLLSVGRLPVIDDIGLDKLEVATEKGRITTDGFCRTSAPNVYAIGDCIEGPQLAHKASYDGILVCDNILGAARTRDYSSVPGCVYTHPEIASVGLTEEAAKIAHPDARVAKFPMLGSGKAYLMGRSEGFVKIIGDAKGAILGIEIMGEGACDLIGEASVARAAGVTIEALSRVIHAHPTLSEALQEAAHIFSGTGIHTA